MLKDSQGEELFGDPILYDKNPKKNPNKFLEAFANHRKTHEGDFRCIVFPIDMDFSGQIFEKDVNFSGAQFLGNAKFYKANFSGGADFYKANFSGDTNFREANFSGNANFIEANFSGNAIFYKANFSGNADFYKANFSGDTNFIEANFSGNANFSKANFSGYADFLYANFSGDADFREANFSGNADFQEANFSGDADFKEATFKQRVLLDQTIFHDEIDFSGAQFAFLKYPPQKTENNSPVLLNGAVLEATQLWGIPSLEHYQFNDGFLLGISLAGKKLIDCDFTGAVMKNVHTDGWELDEATIRNTKYIYTDYTISEETRSIEIEGGDAHQEVTVQVYKPVTESRVPAGDSFGDASNANFTLKDYFFEPHKWNKTLDLPKRMQQAFLEYLVGFEDYVEKTEGIKVAYTKYHEGEKIRIQFETEEENLKERIDAVFQEYLRHVFQPFEDIDIVFRNLDLSEQEKGELFIDHQHALQTIQQKLSYETQKLSLAQRNDTTSNLVQLTGLPPVIINNYIDNKPQALASASNQTQISIQIHNQLAQTVEQRQEVVYEIQDLLDALEAIKETNEAFYNKFPLKELHEATQLTAIDDDNSITPEQKPGRIKSILSKTKSALSRVQNLINGSGEMAESMNNIGVLIKKILPKIPEIFALLDKFSLP